MLVPKVGDIFVHNSWNHLEYEVMELAGETVSLQHDKTTFTTELHNLLRVASLKVSAPKQAAKPECIHNWKTDRYFSATFYTTCTKCGHHKEDT